MAQLNFDANQVAPDQGQIEALPEGWYVVAIDESDVKATDGGKGTGAFVQVRERVIEPAEFRGRIVIGRLNVKNDNPEAVRIGMGQLSALCHATGVLIIQDTQQLHNIPHKIKVAYEPARVEKNPNTGEEKKYGASNQIRAFKPMTENVTLGPSAPIPAPSAPPAVQQQVPAAFAPQQQAQQVPAAPAQAPAAAQQPAWAQAPQQPWQQAAAPVAAPQQAPAQAPVQAPPAQGFQPPWQQQPAAAPQQAPVQQQAPQQGAQVPPWQRQG